MKTYEDKMIGKIIKILKKAGKIQTKREVAIYSKSSNKDAKALSKASDLHAWKKNCDKVVLLNEILEDRINAIKSNVPTTREGLFAAKRSLEICRIRKLMAENLLKKIETLQKIYDAEDTESCDHLFDKIDFQDYSLVAEALTIATKKVDGALLLDTLSRKYCSDKRTLPAELSPMIDILKKYRQNLEDAVDELDTLEETLDDILDTKEEKQKLGEQEVIEEVIPPVVQPETDKPKSKKATTKAGASNLVAKTAKTTRRNSSSNNINI